MIRITRNIAIDEKEIRLRFVTAAGPGGQNVNKVATAVQLRFDARESSSLPEEVRKRLLHMADRRITGRGVVVITARRYRTQERNRRDALDRLAALLRKAAARPKPRRKTKPTPASRARRLEDKRRRGESKRRRAPVVDDR